MATFDNCGTAGVRDVKQSDCNVTLYTRKFGLIKKSSRFPDEESARLKANWDIKIAAGDAYIFPDVQIVESEDTEAQIEVLATVSRQTTGALKQTKYTFSGSVCMYQAMTTFNNTEWEIYPFQEGDIFDYVSLSDGKVKGQACQVFVNIPTTATPSEHSKIEARVRLQDPFEYLKKGGQLKLDSTFGSLVGAESVETKEVGTSLATQVNVSATLVCGGGNVIDLAPADFLVKDVAGVTVVPTSANYNPITNLYEIVGTGFTNGYTIQVIPKITPEVIYKPYNVTEVKNI